MTIDRREFVASGLTGLGLASVGGAAHAGNGAKASLAGTLNANSTATPAAASNDSGASHSAHAVAEADRVTAEEVDPRSTKFRELLAPVAVGGSVAGATVISIEMDGWGRGTAELHTQEGATFRVDVCAKDAGLEHAAVAATEHYELFVRNGGNGSLATGEAVAGVVIALADSIRANEEGAEVAVLTKSEYWARGC